MSNLPYISPDLVSEYQKELSQNASTATIKRKTASLSRFFDWASSAGHLEQNPLASSPEVTTPKVKSVASKSSLSKVLSLSWKLGFLVGGIILVFLLLAKVELPIPFRLAPAAELTTDGNAGITMNGEGVTPTTQPAIASALTPWTIFTKTNLKDAEGNPITTSQQITFKVYKEESDITPLWETSKEAVPDTNGDLLISLDEVPTKLFFENQKLFLGLETSQGEIAEKIQLSTANESSNVQGFYPSANAQEGNIPVIDANGSLVLASESPSLKAKNGNLAIEGQAVTITTPTASDGNIEINPDGSGIVHFLFEGTGENFLNAQAPNLTSGSLYYGIVANNATGYDLLRLQSGSKPVTRFSVDSRGNTNIGGNLNTLGNIQTNSVERLSSSGALNNITGYSQTSGNFSITQSAGDTAVINKNETALSDLLTLTLDERWKTNSDYSALTLKRYNGSSNAYALLVDEGNARFDGQIQLGRFSSNPSAIGQGSLVFNSSDNKVYVWDGSAWTAVGTGTLAFGNITSGTNNSAAMVVDTGASLTYSGTGTINATTLNSIADTSFLRSDTSDNFTSGTLTTNAGTTVDINGDLVVSDSDITFDAANTAFSVTGDLTITPSGGQLNLAGSLNAGGLTNVAYNAFADATDAPDEAAIAADNDLYVGGDLEVDGTIYGSISGAAGSVKWNAITTPDGNLSLSHGENTTTFTWDTADTAATLDGLTLAITNDASTDSNTQRLLVLTNNDDGGVSGTTENLLVLDNKDANEAVTTALEILASSTGTITTAIDVSDAEIGTALAFGLNDIDGTNFDVTGATGNITTAGDIDVNGGNINSSGALTVTPGAGTNLNVTLSTTGDFAVNTNQLYVDTSAGNVGVGTAPGAYKLDVNGTLNIANADYYRVGGNRILTGTGGGFTIGNYDGSGNINLRALGAANTGMINVQPLNSYTNTTGTQSLFTTTGSFAPTSGNAKFIGINLTPTINQTGTATGDYTALQVNVTETAATGTNQLLADFQTGGNSKVVIDSDGNVGIGDSSPLSPLTVGSGDLFQVNSSGIIANIDGVAHTIDDVSGDLTLTSASTLVVVEDNLAVNGGEINTASGNLTFQPAGSGTTANVQIGAGGAGSETPDFFGLDVKSTTGDPVGGFEGAMYYNTFDNKFRCYQDAGWADCIGAGGGGSSVWSDLLDPDDNLVLDMAAFTTTMDWTVTGASTPWVMTLLNNAGSETTQNFVTIQNAATTQETDVNTEALLVLDNADTDTTGSTIVDHALLITNSGGIATGITDAIDVSASDIVNAINIGANNIEGTNFDVDGNGHITVQPGYGLDVNVAGELEIGNITATTVSVGTTAGATINIGAGSGTATINNSITVISGALDVNGAGTNDIAGTLNLSGNALTSTGDLNINPGGGQVTFTDTKTLNIGGKTNVAYNAFANAADSPAEAAISADDDVFIGGDLEVKGNAYITAGGSIDPGFTTGSVVFAGASGLDEDNTNFFWDDTNKRLGILDNTPAYAFVVGSGDLFQVDSSGNVKAPKITVGTGALAPTDRTFYVLDSTALDTTTQYGSVLTQTYTGTLEANVTSYGILNTVNVNATDANYIHVSRAFETDAILGDGNTIDTLQAGVFYSYINSDTLAPDAPNNTATTSSALRGIARSNSTGLVTYQYGLQGDSQLNDAGTVTNAYGNYSRAYNSNAGGTITTAMGSVGTAYTEADGAVIGTGYGVYGGANELAAQSTGGMTTAYGGYFYGEDATTSYGVYAIGRQNTANTETFTNLYGLYSDCIANGANLTITNCYGTKSTISESAGTITNGYAGHFSSTSALSAGYGVYSTLTGASTNSYGVYSLLSGAATQYGLYSSVTSAGGGTAYGLYVDAGTGAGTEYAGIFLHGNVGIGEAAPAAKLEIAQTDAANTEALIIDTEETTDSQAIFKAISDVGGDETEIFVLNADGEMALAGAVRTGTVVTSSYNSFGTNAVTHAGNITSSDDVIISGDVELDGTLFIDGRIIANPAGTAAIILCSTGGVDCSSTATIENTLSTGTWIVDNASNVGKAALIVEQEMGGDIFTASAGADPKVTITNAGNLQFHQASSITTTTGNLTLDSAALTVFADDLSWTAATPNLSITDGETITITDGTNTLLTLSDQGTTGRLTVTDSLQVAGPTAVAYSRFGTVATTHALATSDDVVINGNTELDGILYLDGNTISNDAGTAAMILCNGDATCATSTTLMNILSAGSWTVDNASNVGKAALIVEQEMGGDIFTASSGGNTRVTISNAGNVSINGSGTMLTVGGGTGKVDMGTIDPVYNIGGEKYATYMTAMAGVKEETTGQVNSFKYVEGQGYEHTIDFKALEKGSDLWLFSKAVDIAKNINQMVVLLTPSENVKAWYKIDPKNYTLSIFSSRPTQISYRLTAPRFDSDLWTNYNNNPDSTGFILEDNPLTVNENGEIPEENLPSLADFEIQAKEGTSEKIYKVIQTMADGTKLTIEDLSAFGSFVAGNIKAGMIESKEVATDNLYAFQGTIDHLLVRSGLVSPNIQTALISPLPDEKDITIQVGNNNPNDEPGKLAITNPQGDEVASIDEQGNATFNEVDAQNITVAGDEVATKQSLADIESLLKKVESDQNLLKEAATWNTQTASDSANLDQLALENLYVTGIAAFDSISITKNLTLGTDLAFQSTLNEDGVITNSINTLSAPLSLQSLALAPVEIMAGKLRIETNGDVTINGNLFIAGKIESNGLTLKAQTQNENATEDNNLLSLKDSQGSEIAKVNASGSAEFKEVQTEGLTIAGANFSENPEVVNGEIVTNATAGRGTISSGVSEITIKNQKITDYTLVYVTPTSTTQNNVLYVKEKGAGYFKVGFTNPLETDVTFNWWIIEIK